MNPLKLVEPEDETEEIPEYEYHPSHDYIYMVVLSNRRIGESVVSAAKRLLETMAPDVCDTSAELCEFLKIGGTRNKKITAAHRLRTRWGAQLPRASQA